MLTGLYGRLVTDLMDGELPLINNFFRFFKEVFFLKWLLSFRKKTLFFASRKSELLVGGQAVGLSKFFTLFT
jgi:hypothetical protein